MLLSLKSINFNVKLSQLLILGSKLVAPFIKKSVLSVKLSHVAFNIEISSAQSRNTSFRVLLHLF
jgi:hypothetical protein